MNDQDKIELLKNILLDDERKVRDTIESRISDLDHQINERIELEKKVNPIITDQLDKFKEDIPETLGPSITLALKNQIANAKDDIVEALYPILGQMIKKYVQAEFQKLSEKIEKQRKAVFSIKNWKNRFSNWFSGVKGTDFIIEDLIDTRIVEILVIEKDSGILMGNYQEGNSLENDMVSGMLTAIKTFVEDAFKKSDQDLEVIEYETYKLIINDFKKFNIVSVVEGAISAKFRSQLEDRISSFATELIQFSKINRGDDQINSMNHYIREYLNKIFPSKLKEISITETHA